MRATTNAKTKKGARGNCQCFDADGSEGLGAAASPSGIPRSENQDRASNWNSEGELRLDQIDGGDDFTGKMLGRLKALESEYFSFVNEYQATLKDYLERSKQKESDFKRSIKEVEEEIQRLMAISQEEN